MTLTQDEILERLYPFVPWRKPVRLTRVGDDPVTRLGCRFCIARGGLKAVEIERWYETRQEWEAHMRLEHPMN